MHHVRRLVAFRGSTKPCFAQGNERVILAMKENAGACFFRKFEISRATDSLLDVPEGAQR